jgi:transcriptional regulator with XRE-family HTH domain
MTEKQTLSLRIKMLGAMVREARLTAGKSIRESADLLGVSTGTFSSYEMGKKGISLPELEILAYAYRVPIELFWDTSRDSPLAGPSFDTTQGIMLRQRIIGAQLRKQRQEMDLTIKELSQRLDFPTSRISDYERGKRPIPLPELEMMAEALNHELADYLELDGPVGKWIREQLAYERFNQLPREIQEFIVTPGHEPYLRMAMNLGRLPLEDMQSVAQSLQRILP